MAEKTTGLKAPTKIKTTGLTKQSGLKPPSKAPTPTSSGDAAEGEQFIIGDKVLVSGTKAGKIQYLGECQFAPGQWAGVVLDNPVGKNDGSVAGVRYFQCEPLHGVFARPNKLVRATQSSKTATSSMVKSTPAKATRPAALTVANVKASTAAPSKSKQSGLRSPTSSIRSLKLGGVGRTGAAGKPPDVKEGDRVSVGESKIGTARFVGETDFAKGCWVGIELDEPIGKNDGSVAGKRYFSCAANHGLFALIQKVQKVGFPATTPGKPKTGVGVATTTKKPTKSGIKSPAGSSSVSVSSLSSLSSNKGPSKLRTEVSSRYKQKTAASGVQALQEALLEKQQHVESLMAERDLERNQLMEVNLTAAEKVSELKRLQESHECFRVEKESQLDSLRALVEQADKDKVRLAQELEEEKRKVEDIQFRLEEGEICKDELEALSVDDKSELNQLRNERASFQQQITALRQQIETGSATNVEPSEDDPRVFELEEQVAEAKVLMEEQEDVLAKLRLQVKNLEADKEQLLDQVQETVSSNSSSKETLQNELADLKTQLTASQQQCEGLKVKKEEAEKQLENVLAASGDQNSQVKLLSDAIAQKEENISKLEAKLMDADSQASELQVASEQLRSSLSQRKEELSNLSLKSNASEEALKMAREDLESITEREKEVRAMMDETLASLKTAESSNKQLREEIENLKNHTELLKKNETENGLKFSQVNEDFEKLKQESAFKQETIEKDLSEVQKQRDEFERLHANDESQIVRLSEQLASLQKANNQLRETVDQMGKQKGDETQNLIRQLQETQSLNSKLQSLQVEQEEKLKSFQKEKECLQKGQKELEASVKDLNADIETHKQNNQALEAEKKQLNELAENLQAKLKKMEKSLPDVEERENALKKEFGQERDSLQRSLDITTSLLEEKNKEIDSTKKEVAYLKGEFLVQESLKDRLKEAQTERDRLADQVQRLQMEVNSGESRAATLPSANGADAGADFLNTVIVNQQQTITELTEKIKELEDLAINGDNTLDELDEEERRQLPPRLFCDICDVFDAHDTEDCPTQSMLESEPPQGSDTKYSRGEQRPYCDDCEVFGHWTDECPEESMY